MAERLAGDPGSEEVMREARLWLAASCAIVLGLGAVVLFVAEPGSAPSRLASPAAFAGVLAPALAYRAYTRQAGRVASDPSAATGRAFLKATVTAAGLTFAAALFGLAVHARTSRVPPLIGVATHVILSGAIWPSRERLEAFSGRRS